MQKTQLAPSNQLANQCRRTRTSTPITGGQPLLHIDHFHPTPLPLLQNDRKKIITSHFHLISRNLEVIFFAESAFAKRDRVCI